MTQISPYGIGAGRMVSATSGDDEDRVRQRRVAASRSSEQARKEAAMREQLAQTERAVVLAEALQRQQQEQAGAMRRERQAGSLTQAAESRAATAREARPGQPATPASAAETAIEAATATVTATETATSRTPPAQREPLPSMPEPDSPPLHVDLMPQPTDTPAALVARLIDDLPSWRTQQSIANAEERLDALRQAIVQTRRDSTPDSRKALEVLAGSLEFAQGYLEAGTPAEETRQRLVQIIDDLLQEVAAMMSATATPLVAAPSATAARAIAGSEALRSHGYFAPGRAGRDAVVGRARGAGKDLDDMEAERSAEGGVALAVPPMPVEPPRATAPSLERDSEKRRGETPVSVAVKSI